MASPLWPRFDKAIADETNAIIARQVSPWAHLHAPGQPLVVHRFDGSPMSWPGARYEGAPQQAFWRGYIEPFLEQLVVEQLRGAAQAAKDSGVDAAEIIEEVAALLVAACRKVYARMVDVDARLRSEHANATAHRSTKRELRAMEEFIRKHATATAALAAIASPRTPTFVEYVGRNKYLMILLVLLLVTVGLFVTR